LAGIRVPLGCQFTSGAPP